MDFGIYVTERLAAVRLAELRAESARVAVLTAATRSAAAGRPAERVFARLARWLGGGHGPGQNAGVRVAR